MSLEHILLGLLRRPAFGYELKAQFDATVRHFWAADLAQIYPTLQRLEGRGLLASRREPSPNGPERKVYRLTRAGRAELRRWLRSGPQVGAERFGYLAQLFLMDELADPAATREFLRALRQRLAAWREELLAVERRALEEAGGRDAVDAAAFHPFATLRMGILTLAAKLAWCDESLARLDRLAPPQGGETRSPEAP